jgi:hypothetical protein
VIECLTKDLCEIKGLNDENYQVAWIKVIAAINNDILTFYGLTKVDNARVDLVNESLLRNESFSVDIIMALKNNVIPSKFHYVRIPHLSQSNNHQAEMMRYCSPEPNSKWSPLKNLQAHNIWVLEFKPFPFIAVKDLQPPNSPKVLFRFPHFDTMENIVELEEAALIRHKCTLIPCSDFCLCPTTIEEPNPNDSHLHCMSMKCVRFLKRSLFNPTKYNESKDKLILNFGNN